MVAVSENTESWDRVAAAARKAFDPGVDVVHYGPDAPDESELRLLGDVEGKRVLELGCGAGHGAVALARAGAHVTAVDASSSQLQHAHHLADEHEVRVEWHHGDAAELAFLRADSIDVTYSAGMFAEVEDVDRLLRQVHRVLRPHGTFVCAYEHPMSWCVAQDSGEKGMRGSVGRSYFADVPIIVERFGASFTMYPRRVAEMFASLSRAGFRVDVLLEPEPPFEDSPPLLPTTIVWRARKEGV